MRGKTHCTIGVLTSILFSILLKIPITIFSILLSAFFSLLPDLDESKSLVSDLILKKNISKYLYKVLIFIINITIFFISLKINDNFYISSLVTFMAIFIIESKLTHQFLRKLFLSLIFLLLSVCFYLADVNIYFILFSLILCIFPWLKHRSFSHSLFAIVLIYFILKQIELIYNIYNLAFFGTISYASHIFLGDLFTRQGVPLFYPLSDKKISLGSLKVGGFLSNLIEVVFVLFMVFLIISLLIAKI